MGGFFWFYLITGVMFAVLRVHAGTLQLLFHGTTSPANQSLLTQQTGLHRVKVTCKETQVVVMVEQSRTALELEQPVRATNLSLGDCPYRSLDNERVVFVVSFQECGSQIQLTPDAMIYRNRLFYKAEIASPSEAALGIPSEMLIECHYLRQVPVEGSVCKTKDCGSQAKQRPATRHRKRHLSQQQENVSLTEFEANLGKGHLSAASGKVAIVKLSTAAAKPPGMVLALIVLVTSVVLLLLATTLLLSQRWASARGPLAPTASFSLALLERASKRRPSQAGRHSTGVASPPRRPPATRRRCGLTARLGEAPSSAVTGAGAEGREGMLLGELVAGAAEGLVLIQDSASCEGRTLLKSFVAASALRGESVHVLSFDVPEEEFKAGFSTEVISQILFHDAFQDPLGWAGQDGILAMGDDFSASELAARLTPVMQGPTTVVLDSLSWLLLHLPFPSVCQALAQLPRRANVAGQRIARLVVLLHGDLHQPGELKALHTLVRVLVMLEPVLETVLAGDGAPRTAVMLHRKTGGKVVWKKEYFTVLLDFVLKPLAKPPPDAISKEEEEDDRVSAKADSAASLTFNLHLSEAERQAKESVLLPYHFSEEKKSSLLQTPTGLGKIYYEPDASDDFDEEDPDDDLDV